MGKSLKGKELGSGLSQRKDGRYQAKYYIPGSPKPKYLYDRNLAKLKKKRDLEKAKYIRHERRYRQSGGNSSNLYYVEQTP